METGNYREGLYMGYTGIIRGYLGYIGKLENQMETTIFGLGG